ncbi:MAG: hypothetical protein ACLFVC_04350 [Opitutales bacterium]
MNEGFASSTSAGRSARTSRWLSYGAIAVLVLLGLGLYLLVFRPMTREVADLEGELERTHRRIAETGFGYPAHPGEYLEVARSKLERMRNLAEELSGQTEFYSGMEELLTSPFRVLEFEQRRFDVEQSLIRLADERDSSLPVDFLSGLPSYNTTIEQQELIWPHLEFFNHVMAALLSSGRDLRVERIESLPGRTLREASETEGSLLQLRLRLSVRGPAAALAVFLDASLPGSGDGGNPIGRKAYSIDQLDLRSAADSEDGQVTLDIRLAGFILGDPSF